MKDGHPVVSSLLIAEHFDRNHKDVIRGIRELMEEAEFTERNFALSKYVDSSGRTLPMYHLTRDGFMLVVMGYTGKEALRMKTGRFYGDPAQQDNSGKTRAWRRSLPSRKAVLKTYVTDEECQRITDSARQAGLSVSAFISRVCLGSPVKSKVDDQAVRALVKVNADMGRLGGLLKLWLSERPQAPQDVRPLLNELLTLKDELAGRIQKL